MENNKTNNKPLTRKAQIRHYLLQGNSITELEALQKFNILHLPIIIYNLRKKEGLPILTETLPPKRVAKYYIDTKYLEEYNKNLKK